MNLTIGTFPVKYLLLASGYGNRLLHEPYLSELEKFCNTIICQ